MSSGPLIRGNLHASKEEDDDNDDEYHQQVSCFICSSSSKSKYSSRNPYSARGLEKFSALLADLEEKRRMIYSQIGSQDIFVRFVYSSGSNVVKPIVVKLTNNNNAQKKTQAQPDDTEDVSEAVHNNSDGPDGNPTRSKARPERSGKETMQKSLSWNSGGVQRVGPIWSRVMSGFRKFLRNPSYYMVAAVVLLVLVLVVLLLATFGRTVAVACACVGWYALPTVRVGSKSMRVMKNNKKPYLRKLSANKKICK